MSQIESYRDLLKWMRSSNPRTRDFMMKVWVPGAQRLNLSGLSVLALSCAVRGEAPHVAAHHCRCAVAELDAATLEFVQAVRGFAGRSRRPARSVVIARDTWSA